MSGQVVADMKYVDPLWSAPDWVTFAVNGPGSRRGLNRVLGRPVDAPWTEKQWHTDLGKLYEAILPELDPMEPELEVLPGRSTRKISKTACVSSQVRARTSGRGSAQAQVRSTWVRGSSVASARAAKRFPLLTSIAAFSSGRALKFEKTHWRSRPAGGAARGAGTGAHCRELTDRLRLWCSAPVLRWLRLLLPRIRTMNHDGYGRLGSCDHP